MPITKQTIAIIGACGNMGSAIARSIARGHYRLLLIDRYPEKVGALTDEIRRGYPGADLEPMDCPHESSWEADIILLAVPHADEKDISEKIQEVATQKIVISISNPLNEDLSKLTTKPGISAAEELQHWLPNSKVIKAFNTTFAADFEQPVINGKQVDSFLAGDHEQALKTVSEIVKTVGFNPVIAGDLSVSYTLERMQLLLIQLSIKNGYEWHAGWKILHS